MSQPSTSSAALAGGGHCQAVTWGGTGLSSVAGRRQPARLTHERAGYGGAGRELEASSRPRTAFSNLARCSLPRARASRCSCARTYVGCRLGALRAFRYPPRAPPSLPMYCRQGAAFPAAQAGKATYIMAGAELTEGLGTASQCHDIEGLVFPTMLPVKHRSYQDPHTHEHDSPSDSPLPPTTLPLQRQATHPLFLSCRLGTRSLRLRSTSVPSLTRRLPSPRRSSSRQMSMICLLLPAPPPPLFLSFSLSLLAARLIFLTVPAPKLQDSASLSAHTPRRANELVPNKCCAWSEGSIRSPNDSFLAPTSFHSLPLLLSSPHLMSQPVTFKAPLPPSNPPPEVQIDAYGCISRIQYF